MSRSTLRKLCLSCNLTFTALEISERLLLLWLHILLSCLLLLLRIYNFRNPASELRRFACFWRLLDFEIWYFRCDSFELLFVAVLSLLNYICLKACSSLEFWPDDSFLRTFRCCGISIFMIFFHCSDNFLSRLLIQGRLCFPIYFRFTFSFYFFVNIISWLLLFVIWSTKYRILWNGIFKCLLNFLFNILKMVLLEPRELY